MSVEIAPCSIGHLENLIIGADTFQKTYDTKVIEGYMPFAGALEYILSQMRDSKIWHPWLPYMFLFRPDQALVGFGGFKLVPDSNRTVEIGYSIAPTYQGRGFATSAAHQLIEIAFDSNIVDCVCAYTLAEPNASTKVLERCGMSKVSETVDPDVGNVWRWEINKANNLARAD